MEQERCFNICGNDIWLDQILVDFNEIPLLFICYDANKNNYVVLCTDIEDLQYIIVPQSLESISKMLHQQITMRELFTTSEYFWKVQAKDNCLEDIVEKKCIENIDIDVLPEEGAVFKVLTKELEDYRDNIDSRLLAEITFEPYQIDVNIDDAFNESIGEEPEILINDTGNVCDFMAQITIDYTKVEIGEIRGKKELLGSRFFEASVFSCDFEVVAA